MGDLLHKIKKVIESGDLPYSEAKQEVPVGRGSADIVIYDKAGKAALVIELKQPDGSPVHDPYYPDVVEQGSRYANELGVSYFVTSNLKHFVIWKTFQEGTPLLERQLLHYDAATPLELTIRQILSDLPLLKEGRISFLSIDAKFVRRLKTFHEVLWPRLLEGLEEKIKKDKKFKEDFIEWLFEQDFLFNRETNEKVVKQYSHLLSNKIFFYKLLEGNFSELPKMLRIETASEDEFKQRLNGYFKRALTIDYEAVFSSTFFDTIPLDTNSITLFNQFISELEKYRLSEIEYDIIGKVFESLIPIEERHYLGQYYTRADVVDLIEEFCIKSPSDAVFDPACGSGTFLVRAYYLLKQLERDKNHRDLLSQIYGTDINQFAAHLSVINLTIRNLSELTNKVNVLVNDFFELRPTLSVLLPFSGKNIRNENQKVSIPKFDVVVANPPYTRQEELGEYSDKYKKFLEAALNDDWGKQYSLGKRAGIHAYFLLHAPKFLKPKGRLGFIVSNSWMDAEYGKEIQKMLLENFNIKAIIESKAERWFEDAAINTCIIIAEREDGQEKRMHNTTKFVLLKKKLPDYSIKKLVRGIQEKGDSYEDDEARVCCISQGELWQEGLVPSDNGILEWQGAKWGKYLRAPQVFFRILRQKDKLKPLAELAEIKYGIKTGATDFFVIPRRSAKKLGIEPRFLTPIIHSTKELTRPIVKEENVPNVLFSTTLDRISLRGTNALSYIKMGEIKKINKRRSVTGRKNWWSIEEQEPPEIILTRFYGERHFAVYNKNKLQIEDIFFGLHPKSSSALALVAYLNSSLFALTKELYGRLNLGEGVLTVYGPDWKKMPVLNVEALTKEEKQNLEKAFLRLARREIRQISEELKLEDRRSLDDIVFNILRLTQRERKEIYITLQDLVRERVTKAKSVRRNGNNNGKKRQKAVISRGEQQTISEFVL